MGAPVDEEAPCLAVDVPTCTICLEQTDEEAPCACKGTAGHVHDACLSTWRDRFAADDYRKWVCPQCDAAYADTPSDDATRGVIDERLTAAGNLRGTSRVFVTVAGWMCLSLISDVGAGTACFLPDRCRNAWLALVVLGFVATTVVAAPTAARRLARATVGSLALLSLVPTDDSRLGPFVAVFDALVASAALAI
jgi:hypothetical protein